MYETRDMKSSRLYISLLSAFFLFFSTNVVAKTELLDVSIKPLSSILLKSKNSVPANIVSLNTTIVSAEITGRAIKVHKEIGDTVKKGEKLVSLDCRSYSLAKKQAEASLKVSQTQLSLAKKQLARNQRLVKQGTIPRELFERTEANQQTSLADIELKKSIIETSQLSINRCTIKAPFSAQITNRMVQKGQLLMPSTPLFELMQNDKMEVKAQFSPKDVANLDTLPLIEFIVGDKRYKSIVRSVIQRVDETTRTQEVRLSLPLKTSLAAGLSGRIEWSDIQKKIPSEYILRNNAELGIMVVEDIIENTGKARFKVLKTAIEGQPSTTSLPSSTLLLDKNRYRVTDGQLIHIQK